MAKHKTFMAPIQLKADGDDGSFRAVFARFNEIDHDGDVTLPGAFQDGQQVVVEGWNHDYSLPVGKGAIHADTDQAWIDGQFFLDTEMGKATYATLKSLGGLEEWSYTFDIEEAERGTFQEERVTFLKALDVWGVAPVTRGAGIGTRTISLKGAGGLTDDEVQRLKALLNDDDADTVGDRSEQHEMDSGDGEGEVLDGDKPSAAPGVVLAQIDILQLEE